MRNLLSPLCLLLALAMIIAGFAMWSVGAPQAGVDLHHARAAGDEDYEEALEAQLARRQWSRRVLLGGLFAGSLMMTVLAFLVMPQAK